MTKLPEYSDSVLLGSKRKIVSPHHDGTPAIATPLGNQSPGFRDEVACTQAHKRMKLHIDTSSLEVPAKYTCSSDALESPLSTLSSPSSLFDEDATSFLSDSDLDTSHKAKEISPADSTPGALSTAPDIPGLYFNPSLLLPSELAAQVTRFCLETYFTSPGTNQVMLFGRAPSPSSSSDKPDAATSDANSKSTSNSGSSIPPVLTSLLAAVSDILLPILPPHTHDLLFSATAAPVRARQVIINLYNPGEGITPHVDLLRRFGDGIVGVSLQSGCVMQFAQCQDNDALDVAEEQLKKTYDVYLPERSVLVLSGDARYKWTHGIEGRKEDLVVGNGEGVENDRLIERGVRLSITYRWLLPGADVVGGIES